MEYDKIGNIKLIAMDVDGVLTPGDVTYTSLGDEIKTFSIKDGVAIRAAQSIGVYVAVISGRKSVALEHRMKELKVEKFEPGCRDKSVAVRDLLSRLGLRKEEAAFIGDDLIDIPAFREVGFRIAVGDACEDIKSLADHVTQAPGGKGAVREAVELILRAQGKWARAVESIVERYQRPVEANGEPDNPAHQ